MRSLMIALLLPLLGSLGCQSQTATDRQMKLYRYPMHAVVGHVQKHGVATNNLVEVVQSEDGRALALGMGTNSNEGPVAVLTEEALAFMNGRILASGSTATL